MDVGFSHDQAFARVTNTECWGSFSHFYDEIKLRWACLLSIPGKQLHMDGRLNGASAGGGGGKHSWKLTHQVTLNWHSDNAEMELRWVLVCHASFHTVTNHHP